MKYVRDQTGRFAQRPHYEPKELDVLFERIISNFLKSKHDRVGFPITTDDLTVLIEQDVDDLDAYADLSNYGTGVEGVTEFRPGRKPNVRISRTLSTSDSRENRYRTTLTHEFGHVRLHGHLFEIESSGSLFESAAKKQVIACKRDTMIKAARNDWMEWQAGYACGAMLMPVSHVRASVDVYRKAHGLFGPVEAGSPNGQAMIDRVVDHFQVSPEAARVRLNVLGILGSAPAERALFA